MTGKVLMVQGTMSSAGKSLLVTGLGRIFVRKGLRVAPFKAQNMSNNAAVCADGAEIGRAQYTQARACRVEPRAAMNPILIKPETDSRSQVIVRGKPYANFSARDYYKHSAELWNVVTSELDGLREEYDLVIIEGAGSPVELNLKNDDIVNMAVAKYAQAPVLLAGDIDRGGIFAQMLGTLWLLDPEEQKLVKGLLINKFRGDSALFVDGVRMIEEKSKLPVVGVIPYIHHQIPEEDAVAIEAQNTDPLKIEEIDIVVIRLPRISNFDDFDPLGAEKNVSIRYADSPRNLGRPDAVILPGTKSTMADLVWLQEQGLDKAIQNFSRRGGVVVGICGGYQMLGEVIRDPESVESQAGEVAGLGLLPAETIFYSDKSTYQIQAVVQPQFGWMDGLQDAAITGYEIHMGVTRLQDGNGWLKITSRSGNPTSVLDGGGSREGRTWGCYIHGIFENDAFRWAWLTSLGWQREEGRKSTSLDASIDYLADEFEKALDMDFLDQVIA